MMHDHPTFKMSKEFWIQKIKKSRCCPFYTLMCELNLDDCWMQPKNLAEKEIRDYNKRFYQMLLSDREIIEAFIQNDGTSIYRLSRVELDKGCWVLEDRNLVLMAIKSAITRDIEKASLVAEEMSVLLTLDPDFMLELVAVNKALIKFAHCSIRRSKDFVKLAMHVAGKDIFNHLSEQDKLALLE
jgi:hypothetical protein